jgi:DNA-binding NtrC family response regulator
MVIEDDEEMRSLLRDFFEEEGFETDSASNGAHALQKLTNDHFDLIITDIRMPTLTGLDILARIKRLKPGTPVIVITAFGSDEVYRKSLERGATACLEKPVHFDQLRTLIHDVVSVKEKRINP